MCKKYRLYAKRPTETEYDNLINSDDLELINWHIKAVESYGWQWELMEGEQENNIEKRGDPKKTDLTGKCGSCKWAMPIQASNKGILGSYVKCINPAKVWRYDASNIKQRTTPKCRWWQPKKEED